MQCRYCAFVNQLVDIAPDFIVRGAAESALFDLLLELARAEKDPEIKQGMVFWMGNFDDPRAADFLLEILNEE